VTERERLDLWSAQNPRDEIARAAICAWNGCPPEAMPASWAGHTCPATKDAWERVGQAVARVVAASLAARWRGAMADWDQGGEAALVEMDNCIAGQLPE
jgi:hypothetical protein